MCTKRLRERLRPDDDSKSSTVRGMEGKALKDCCSISSDNPMLPKEAGVTRLVEAWLKWPSHHHIGARVHPAFYNSVYLSRG